MTITSAVPRVAEGASIHRAISADGTQIAGRVLSDAGPPIVLFPSGPGDSETSWRLVAPLLCERFTCMLVDTRGRGLSADGPDHSPDRLVQDVLAFVESLGEPAGIVEWGTTLWARVAAEGSSAVAAAVAYEPGADEVMRQELQTGLEELFSHLDALLADGRLVEAAEAFIDSGDLIYPGEELASGVPAEFWRMSARNLSAFLAEERASAEDHNPGATEPTTLARIPVPVLLLQGSSSSPWFTDSVRHVARFVPQATIRRIEAAGHWGPYLQPRSVANELERFVEDALAAN
jgi:pimeloyl-ACP methyl ester carboxylesterase